MARTRLLPPGDLHCTLQALVDVRRADDGVEPLPGVNEAGVGDVEEAPRVGVPVAPVLGDAAVDADETRCMY
jgi:hypothetical protein